MTISHLERVGAPSVEPVTLTEAKDYLRVDEVDDDTLITNLISAARKSAENYMKRSLITQSWKVAFDDYSPSYIRLPMGAVQSVTSLKIIARDGTETLIDAAKYYLVAAKNRLVVDTPLIGHRVEVIYVAGFGDNASDVPEEIRQGLLNHIAYIYENRGESLGINHQSKSLYDHYRVIAI